MCALYWGEVLGSGFSGNTTLYVFSFKTFLYLIRRCPKGFPSRFVLYPYDNLVKVVLLYYLSKSSVLFCSVQ